MKILIIATLFIAGLSCSIAQELPKPDQILAKVNEVIPGLNISGLKNLNVSNLPVDEGQKLLKSKCEKNGGENAFNKAQKATQDIVKCVTPLINKTQLMQEIEKAKPTGDLDLVFKKYCDKKQVMEKCITDYLDAVEPCFDEKERENRKIVQNITDSLLSFVCFKDGDRIALFIAAGGPQCFQSKQQVIQQCIQSTFAGARIPSSFANILNVENLPSLVIDKKTCQNMEKLQACSVKELEGCEDPTPANLVDSIFNFVKKVTPCQSLLAE